MTTRRFSVVFARRRKAQMSTASDIDDIRRRLRRMGPTEVNEVKNFVDFLARKGSSDKPERKLAKLRGIWKGLGFEKLDLESEIRAVRKEFGQSIRRRSEQWNT
jgi:hypothetical protein